jgi:hypothetical protein
LLGKLDIPKDPLESRQSSLIEKEISTICTL